LSDAAAKPEVPRRLTIATRESALAMWQAEHIRAQLAARYPASEVILLGMTTEGDRVQDRSLADVGGKGLFIKELEVAMADGRADLAVHSLKDIPMDMPEGFVLAAITARDDPRDAFVSNHYLDIAALPGGARIGRIDSSGSRWRNCASRRRLDVPMRAPPGSAAISR